MYTIIVIVLYNTILPQDFGNLHGCPFRLLADSFNKDCLVKTVDGGGFEVGGGQGGGTRAMILNEGAGDSGRAVVLPCIL